MITVKSPFGGMSAALVMTAMTALAWPARAEAQCPARPAHATTAARLAGAGELAATLARVTGGGRGVLSDAFGGQFRHQFSIAGIVRDDGTASGKATFVFPRPFAQVWGALPSVDLMHLDGEITEGWVEWNGDVTLVGPFVETDYSRGDGVVFQEDSRVSGVGPLIIAVSPGSKTFTFTWCELMPFNDGQLFSVEVTQGTLSVN